ncbi:MAG: hypothetical protein IJ194_03035 [Bacilli bacterium]|nr:hypothetical protein [Bacilli bacterium]
MEIKDRSSVIFGNKIDEKTIKKANKSKAKFIKKYRDDSNKEYHLKAVEIPSLKEMGVKNLVFSDEKLELPENAVIVGNIRMGFGHYRISMAMASCAKALGYEPYWLDLASFDATGSKMIREQNDLYSLASRISQKSKLFNKFFWEPLNSEGFRQITYNAGDQKNAELLVPILHDLPKDVPYIATHVWPSQAAVHAGLTHVVNAIPDNWPMGLHLSEGAIHAVQTPFAYLGYKMLNGMGKKPLKGIPESDLYEVGHYIDHELVSNVEEDVAKRIARIQRDEPRRILMSVGGAGAGQKLFLEMMKHLIPYVKEKKAALFLNFGDHKTVYDYLCKQIPNFDKEVTNFFDEYDKLNEFVSKMDNEVVEGIYCIYNSNIFEAVYSTNLLMRKVEMLITKPSELAYYPVVKVMMRHIGGHEVYGAINAQELGDSTFECPDKKSMNEMLDRLLTDDELLIHLNKQIIKLKQEGIYNGGYEVVKLAVNGRKS